MIGKNKKKNYDYITADSSAYSLVWLQNVWLKSRKIGLNWVILQMKVYLPIYRIDECLIVDEDDEQEFVHPSQVKEIDNTPKPYSLKKDPGIPLKDHPIYAKFFKMKKFGIPTESIQHKLKMESLDPGIILKNENDTLPNESTSSAKHVLSNGHNHTPNQTRRNTGTRSAPPIGGLMGVLSGLGNIKLKKAKKNKKPDPKPSSSGGSNRPPTLAEIVRMRSTLKKTNSKLLSLTRDKQPDNKPVEKEKEIHKEKIQKETQIKKTQIKETQIKKTKEEIKESNVKI